MMFGLDLWIWLGYITAFASVIGCLIYGWRKRDDDDGDDDG